MREPIHDIVDHFPDPLKFKGGVGHPYGHDLNYYITRGIVIDNRGTLVIAGDTMFGFNIYIFTQSHDLSNLEKIVDRPVHIGRRTFIGSNSTLYNCKIGDDCVVSIGSVVSSCEVPDNSMVEGNPAKIIATRVNGKWTYLNRRRKCLSSQS